MMDTPSLGEYCKRGLCNQLDHYRNTPLSLAFKVQHSMLECI